MVNESLALCLMKDFPCHQPLFPPHLHMNLWQQRKLLGVSVNVNDFPFALWADIYDFIHSSETHNAIIILYFTLEDVTPTVHVPFFL